MTFRQCLSGDAKLVVPAEFSAKAFAPHRSQTPTCPSVRQSIQRLLQPCQISTSNQKAIRAVPENVSNTSGSIADHRKFVRPRFQEDESERVGSRRQREDVDSGEKVSLLDVAERTQLSYPRNGPKVLPEPRERCHGRPAENDTQR